MYNGQREENGRLHLGCFLTLQYLHFQYFLPGFALNFETNKFIKMSCLHLGVILPFELMLEFEFAAIIVKEGTEDECQHED